MAKRIIIFILSMLPLSAVAQTGALPTQLCVQAGIQASTSGIKSSNYLNGVIPYCTVTVYLTGTTNRATIYSDSTNTPLINPFTARSNGQFLVFAAVNQGYDVVLSGGIPPNNYVTPLTLTDIYPSTQFTSTGITSITGVNGYDCTTGSCNISGQSVDFEINGSQASSQILRNFVDGANTTVVDNGGGYYEVDASGGSLVNAVTIPDGTGQHIILWATSGGSSNISGHTSVTVAPPGGGISMGTGVGDCFGLGSCSGRLTLDGFTLTGTGLTCADVTSVRPFLIASINSNVPGNVGSSPGESFSPALAGPEVVQFTGDSSSAITCADIGSASISIEIDVSAGVPFAPVTANAFGAGLIVEYSGSPVPQPTSIGVYSPLYVDGAGSLHLSPINLGSQGDGGVLGTLGIVNGGGGATTAPAILANLLGNPSANTYSINCTSTTNCVPVTGGGGGGAWSSLTNPTGNLALNMGAYTSTWTYNATTGSGDLMGITDTASNTGTGNLLHIYNQAGSTETPFALNTQGTTGPGWKIDASTGAWASVNQTTQGMQLNGALTAVAGIANYATYLADSSGKPEARTGTGSPSLLCTAANIGSADCPVSGGGGNYVNLCSLVTLTNATCTGGVITVTPGSSSFTISSIPQTSINLELTLNGVCSNSGGCDADLQFNGDTGATNYNWTINSNGSVSSHVGNSSLHACSTGGTVTHDAGGGKIVIDAYTSSLSKVVNALCSNLSGSTYYQNFYSGQWANSTPAAITSINVTPSTGTWGTLIATLYGTN